LNINISRKNNITTGQIYGSVIEKERNGSFLGQTVQFIPHIIEEIKSRIVTSSKDHEISLVEIGGTVGDYENIAFLLAAKQLERELGKDNVAYVLVSYLPVPLNIKEAKTKPTQQSIRMLYEHGIFPDFILCRAIEPLDDVRKNKIASYINLDREQIISAPDVVSLYQIPINFEKENLGKKILKKFNLEAKKVPDWTKWQELLKNIISPKGEVDIAIVGKYIDIGNYKLEDSYISIKESLMHAGAHLSTKVNIFWIDSKEFEQQPEKVSTLKDFDGIIIPGGFGSSGVEGKIMAIKFCRENKIPYLGLCYGLHLAVVEFARNICDLKNANTSEICNTDCAVIDILPWQKAILEKSKYGATMRLGSYAAKLDDDSLVYGLYKKFASNKKTISPVIGKTPPPHVFERHRHRYEVNPAFHEILQEKGLIFSGYHISDEGAKLIEFIELPREKHPFFIATQAHPEFKSSFESPAPLFAGFVLASINKKESTQDE